MNRYAAAGINGDAFKGKRIIVITRDTKASRDALEQITEAAPLGVDITIRRANGTESISYPTTGGVVIIRSYRQGARGYAADILYLDEGADALVRSTDAWASLYANLATSQHAEVIRA